MFFFFWTLIIYFLFLLIFVDLEPVASDEYKQQYQDSMCDSGVETSFRKLNLSHCEFQKVGSGLSELHSEVDVPLICNN